MKNMSEREQNDSTDVEEFSESGGTDPSTAVGFQAMTVTETKSWESNRICMSPKQTPKAMLTLRCYFMK